MTREEEEEEEVDALMRYFISFHFISSPFVCILQADILQSGPTYGLDEKMFTEPSKLHITIGVMCLMDDVDRSTAVQLLNDCREKFIV